MFVLLFNKTSTTVPFLLALPSQFVYDEHGILWGNRI